MNSATREYIRAHAQDGAAAIAKALAADFSTANNIDRKALAALLLSAGLNSRFRQAREHPETPAPIVEGLWTLQDIVTSGIDYIETRSPGHGASMAQLLGGLQLAKLLSADEAAQLIALAGGYQYERDLSVEQVQEALDAIAAEEVETDLRQRLAAGYNTAVAAVDAGERDWEAVIALIAEG